MRSAPPMKKTARTARSPLPDFHLQSTTVRRQCAPLAAFNRSIDEVRLDGIADVAYSVTVVARVDNPRF